MRNWFLAGVLAACFVATGCTENQMARSWGGTATETLPPGQKLVTMTWKQDSMWVLTRPMRADEQPETYTFKEKSNFGAIEGTVIIKEQR